MRTVKKMPVPLLVALAALLILAVPVFADTADHAACTPHACCERYAEKDVEANEGNVNFHSRSGWTFMCVVR
jgi:hypothetical protein